MPDPQNQSLLNKLLQNNLISKKQAKFIAHKKNESGGTVVEHLLSEGFLEEKQILSCFINQCGFHFINLDKIEVDLQAVAELPLELIQELRVLPIRRTKNMLAVVMVDPLDAETQQRLAETTVYQVLPFVCRKKQLDETIKQLAEALPAKTSLKTLLTPAQEGMPLVEHFSFENFITGVSNEFPYAMAMAVARAPGTAYNPFFLYSEVGLGKTHLMNAIGNFLLKQSPNFTVMYATCEYFCSRVVEAIKENRVDEFRESFRQLDLLLIDDIEFLGGRDRAQEEFFHIFNSLVQSGKQIVLTNDRPPSELSVLEKRLQSRFMGGTIASIDAPDLETRLAILTKKSDGITVPQDVLHLLAEKFNNNIRELEGALKTLISFHRFSKSPINMEMLGHTLQEMGR